MNEIKEKFYKTFGIELKTKYYCPKCKSVLEDWWYGGKYPNYECSNKFCDYETFELREDFKNLYKEDVYPPITDRIVLKLLWLIINQNGHYDIPIMSDVNDLKRYILKTCTFLSVLDEFKAQVQSLFKGGE